MKSAVTRVFGSIALMLFGAMAAAAMIPSPLISKGKTVVTSTGSAAALVDGKYGAGAFTFSANSWFAIDIGTGPTKVFITWNTVSYTWSDKIADPNRSDCKQTPSYPVNYTIRTSANSSDGTDGEWATAATVTDNKVTARGHNIDFTGKRWVKMTISSANRTNDKMDEVEVFNTSNGTEDTWFFTGTSISAGAYKSYPTIKTFSTLINESYSEFNPAIVRGGIPCITTVHFKRDISMYLEAAGSCHFWAIEIGTNDAWNGTTDNVATFKDNMQVIIDSCKARGIQPIIANVLATDSAKAKWQINPAYAKTVSDLTKSNNLIEGADLFAGFKNNAPCYNSDGVHLSSAGGAAMYKLWADKMGSLYKGSVVDPAKRVSGHGARLSSVTVASKADHLLISNREPGIVSIFALDGKLLKRMVCLTAESHSFSRLGTGRCLIVHFTATRGPTTTHLTN